MIVKLLAGTLLPVIVFLWIFRKKLALGPLARRIKEILSLWAWGFDLDKVAVIHREELEQLESVYFYATKGMSLTAKEVLSGEGAVQYDLKR